MKILIFILLFTILYQIHGSSWIDLGSVTGEDSGDYIGRFSKISFSEDGSRLAIVGATLSYDETIYVFEYQASTNTWEKIYKYTKYNSDFKHKNLMITPDGSKLVLVDFFSNDYGFKLITNVNVGDTNSPLSSNFKSLSYEAEFALSDSHIFIKEENYIGYYALGSQTLIAQRSYTYDRLDYSGIACTRSGSRVVFFDKDHSGNIELRVLDMLNSAFQGDFTNPVIYSPDDIYFSNNIARSISMSDDGNVIAYSFNYFAEDTPRNRVFVYKGTGTYSADTTWELISDFQFEMAVETVSLSGDGTRILISDRDTTLYEYSGSGTSWTQLITPFNTDVGSGSTYKYSVLASDGYRAAEASDLSDTGQVIFKQAPTPSPTTSPTVSPTLSPSISPTSSPTGSPTTQFDLLQAGTKTIARKDIKSTGTNRFAIVDKIIEKTDASTTLSNQKMMVSGSNSYTFNAIPGLTDAQWETQMNNKCSSVISSGTCAVTMGYDGGSRRRRILSDNAQLVFTITYEMTSDTFSTVESEFSDDTAFVEELKTNLGVEDVELVTSDGELTVIVTVLEIDGDVDDPIDTDALDGILDDLETTITDITTEIITELGVTEDEITPQTIDRCAGRTCNGRGTCNADTGICENCDEPYVGINCEYSITGNCQNGGNSVGSYCVCVYPYYGIICENEITTC